MPGATKRTKISIDIGLRIKETRIKRGLSTLDFGKLMGVSASSVSNWEAGRAAFPADTLMRIAKALDVRPAFLLEGKIGAAEGPSIELLGLAACGTEGWYNANPIALRAPAPAGLERTENVFAVIAVGKSMEPDGIREGNVLYCDSRVAVNPGDAVFVESRGLVTVKRFIARENGKIHLQGWLDPHEDGQRKKFALEVSEDFIEMMAAVVMVGRKG